MPTPISKTLMDKINRMKEKGDRRRSSKQRAMEIVEIDSSLLSCPPNELEAKFRDYLCKLRDTNSSSLESYQIILNSLADLYERECPGQSQTNSQSGAVTILKKILQNCNPNGDDDSPSSIYEHELFCLLEMSVLRTFPVHLSQMKIVNRLRVIYYLSEPTAFRQFLDVTFCDEFLDELPFYLAGIYEQLELENMPVELHKFQSQEFRQKAASDGIPIQQRNRLADKLEEFLKEIEHEEDQVEERNEPEIPSSSANGENPKNSMAPKKPKNEGKFSLEMPIAKRRILKFVPIPATPEKSAETGGEAQGTSPTSEVVEQTPIGRIYGGGSNSSVEISKLGELLRREEERLSKLEIHKGTTKQRHNTATAKRALYMNKIAMSEPKDTTTYPPTTTEIVKGISPKKKPNPHRPMESRKRPASGSGSHQRLPPKRRLFNSSRSSNTSVVSFPFSHKS